MLITIHNIRSRQLHESVVQRVRLISANKEKRGIKRFLANFFAFFLSRNKYKLLKGLDIELRKGQLIHIPEGFIWDLSSVPRFLWGVFPPDGDFELAALIHDYLYVTKIMTRKQADEEMFAWSKAVAGTLNRSAWSDHDNWIRYAMVRVFGWAVYYKRK